ncbi:hypothetical protein [Lysinibacillus cavernae]|uniref:hypothetical protein n=1 Tax=Lysinibacillus cavernae TaxID=2666135 RepID=UPI0012D861D5|nr:hypothetical protein [Lysinibacillus cavernae]
MRTIQLLGYKVIVHIEQTKELYAPLPLISDKEHCGCEDCSYYVKGIVHTSPAIQQFFQQFGIDPRKQGEIWKAADYSDGTRLYIVEYYFVGKVEDTEQIGWIEMENAKFALTNVSESLPNIEVESIIALTGEIIMDS